MDILCFWTWCHWALRVCTQTFRPVMAPCFHRASPGGQGLLAGLSRRFRPNFRAGRNGKSTYKTQCHFWNFLPIQSNDDTENSSFAQVLVKDWQGTQDICGAGFLSSVMLLMSTNVIDVWNSNFKPIFDHFWSIKGQTFKPSDSWTAWQCWHDACCCLWRGMVWFPFLGEC